MFGISRNILFPLKQSIFYHSPLHHNQVPWEEWFTSISGPSTQSQPGHQVLGPSPASISGHLPYQQVRRSPWVPQTFPYRSTVTHRRKTPVLPYEKDHKPQASKMFLLIGLTNISLFFTKQRGLRQTFTPWVCTLTTGQRHSTALQLWEYQPPNILFRPKTLVQFPMAIIGIWRIPYSLWEKPLSVNNDTWVGGKPWEFFPTWGETTFCFDLNQDFLLILFFKILELFCSCLFVCLFVFSIPNLICFSSEASNPQGDLVSFQKFVDIRQSLIPHEIASSILNAIFLLCYK